MASQNRAPCNGSAFFVGFTRERERDANISIKEWGESGWLTNDKCRLCIQILLFFPIWGRTSRFPSLCSCVKCRVRHKTTKKKSTGLLLWLVGKCHIQIIALFKRKFLTVSPLPSGEKATSHVVRQDCNLLCLTRLFCVR